MSLDLFETIRLERDGRLLKIILNQPETLNAVNLKMHEELAQVFSVVATDTESDVIMITGAGRGFSAGGDLNHLKNNAENPELFNEEIRLAKRILLSLLDLDKPIVCKMNGHAVGLGATIALFCDVVFASEKAKIGDPHVAIGLVAGDGGAIIWPHLIGLNRAKEYLLTGEILSATKAEQLGLINHCVAPELLDQAVAEYCQRLLSQPTSAVRWTKVLLNIELKRLVSSVLDAGIAYEAVSVASKDHRQIVEQMLSKNNAK